MNIAVYLRVSTEDQKTELQKKEIERFIALKEWDTHTIIFYDDHGMSGTTSNRAELKRLLKDAKEGRVQKLIIWKLDRLFRSLKDLITTLQLLDQLKVEFISIKDNIDLSSASGRLMMHMLGAFAEFEASLIRERVNAGLDNARSKGIVLGRPRVIDYLPILEARKKGLSYSQIQKSLNISRGAVKRALSKRV